MTLFTLQIEVPELADKEKRFRIVLEKHEETKLKRWQRKIWMRRTKQKGRRGFMRLLAPISITLGSIMLTTALWPIISYFLFTSPDLQNNKLISPLPAVPVFRQAAAGTIPTAQAATLDTIRPKIIQDDLDYTNLSNWFGENAAASDQLLTAGADGTKEYILDIPELDIHNASVRIGGNNLDHNLVEYPGTADPGQYGAPVIFGHSILRQFYNPSEKNSRRYMSIFSKIMTLKPGDKIYLTYDNIKYTYAVLKKVEVKPEDTYILEQEYSAKQLKLVTCVPEGTFLRRGVVLAQLEQEQ